jgi:hypothetical protein
MLKRLATIAAVFFFSTATLLMSLPMAQADTTIPSTVTKSVALASASQAVPSSNLQSDPLNYIPPPPPLQVAIGGITYSYGYLAYGQPHGNFEQDHYRYAGYDWLGEDETNLAFPPDQNADGADFASASWVNLPWQRPQSLITGAKKTPWDGDASYTEDLLYGLLYSTGSYGNTQNVNGYTLNPLSGANDQLWVKITDYAHILMPPTQYTLGIARMWHLVNGTLWYVTIPMPPLILEPLLAQPALVVTPAQSAIYVGQTQDFKATYYPNWLVDPADSQPVTTDSAWISSDPAAAPVIYGSGVATGKFQGSTNITATYAGITGTGQLLVSAKPTPVANPQSGGFNLQGVSQVEHDTGAPDGSPEPSWAVSSPYVGMVEPIRPPGTAEWTDYVTGTVTPPVRGSTSEA